MLNETDILEVPAILVEPADPRYVLSKKDLGACRDFLVTRFLKNPDIIPQNFINVRNVRLSLPNRKVVYLNYGCIRLRTEGEVRIFSRIHKMKKKTYDYVLKCILTSYANPDTHILIIPAYIDFLNMNPLKMDEDDSFNENN